MKQQLRREFELIQAEHGSTEIDSDGRWFVVREWPLPSGWNKRVTAVLVVIPPGYPVTPPDDFYTDNDLRLASGKQPGNTTLKQYHLGQQWLRFSYHVEKSDWQPHADILKGHNLLTFLTGVESRLAEAS